MKKILHGEEARQALKRGVDALANAVKATIGPKGRNVIIATKYGLPLITNDGVSIAKEIDLPDPFENVGAQIVKEASIKTNDSAGDGTSSSTLLAQAMITEGFAELSKGANPVMIRKGIERAVDLVETYIDDIKKDVSSKEDIAKVASLSAADPDIGILIAETIDAIGKDGTITIEESKSMNTEAVLVDGLRFDGGYVSPYMTTDGQRMESVLNTPYVLLTDKKIHSFNQIVPACELAVGAGVPLLIIADEVEGEALQTLIANKLKGLINCVAVKCPGHGDLKKEYLQDISVLTGASIFSDENGLYLEEVSEELLGAVESATITRDHTTLVNGCGDKEKLQERIDSLKIRLEDDITAFEKEKLRERIAKLVGGVAVIKVGAPTETELKERKLRIEDALNATRAAIEEGIVPGGGATFLKAIRCIPKNLKGEVGIGYNIVAKALDYPVRQILSNSGIEEKEIESIRSSIKANEDMTYDALKEEMVNAYEHGIIDPAKVVKSALKNAASIASTLLTTDSIVAEVKE